MAAHLVVRATEDLDLVPAPGTANLDALANALLELDARLLRDPEHGLVVPRPLETGIGRSAQRRARTSASSLGRWARRGAFSEPAMGRTGGAA